MSASELDLRESPVSFPGPFTQNGVVVSGYSVPFLHAQVHDGGKMTVVLDDRFGIELTVDEAERVVPFVADAIAIALGYEAHPSADDTAPVNRSPHPKPKRIETLASADDA